jgi:hypothetical protein
MGIELPPFPVASTRSKFAFVILPFPSHEITPPTTYAPLCELLELNSITKLPDNKLLGGGAAVTVTVCVAVAAGSVVDAAVIVTVPLVGIAGGAE